MNMHESVFASFNDFSPFKYIQSTYPPVTIPLYFIWPLNTQTRKHAHTHTHARVSMHRSSSLTMCKVHANNYHFTGRFALSSPPLTLSQRYLSSQVPTKDNLEICERWEDLSDESPTGNVEKKASRPRGTRDGRRRNAERGMYHHAHRCPHVLYWEEGSVFCWGVSDLHLSYPRIRDAIDICHVAFMNPLCLTDYALLIVMEVWGPEEMLLKIKGSGDVKVVSRVIRHQRLRLQAVMSAPSSRLASLIYLLTDFMSRRFLPWLTDWLHTRPMLYRCASKEGTD